MRGGAGPKPTRRASGVMLIAACSS